MPRINLLPWRAARRKELQQEFIMRLAFSLIMAAVVIGGVHYYISEETAYQNDLNGMLEKEIAETKHKIDEVESLKKKIKSLRARMDIVQRLQIDRPDMVHLFDEIPRLLPDGVYLTSLKQKDQSIILEGVAQSNAQVSNFLTRINASKWLTSPTLEVIQTVVQDHDSVSKFTIHARQIHSDDSKGGAK